MCIHVCLRSLPYMKPKTFVILLKGGQDTGIFKDAGVMVYAIVLKFLLLVPIAVRLKI